MPPGFGFGWWAKDQYKLDSDTEQVAFLETLTDEQDASPEKPDLVNGLKGQRLRVVAQCSRQPSSAGCWLLDGEGARLVKLTDLFDTFRYQFTAKELVDFYLGLPIYLKKRYHEKRQTKSRRVDKNVGARSDVVGISLHAARALLIDAGLKPEEVPDTAEGVKDCARNMRKQMKSMASSWIGKSCYVPFTASILLPPFVLDRMPGYVAGAIATTRVMLFCPATIRCKNAEGKMEWAVCFRTAADVTAKFQLRHEGKVVNGFYCDRCSRQPRRHPPPPCRLLYVWWAGMPPQLPPLQIVLMDIGDQQLDKGSSSADPVPLLDELQGRMVSDELKAGEEKVTRIRMTGEKAKALWQFLCKLGSRPVAPGAPRSSTGETR